MALNRRQSDAAAPEHSSAFDLPGIIESFVPGWSRGGGSEPAVNSASENDPPLLVDEGCPSRSHAPVSSAPLAHATNHAHLRTLSASQGRAPEQRTGIAHVQTLARTADAGAPGSATVRSSEDSDLGSIPTRPVVQVEGIVPDWLGQVLLELNMHMHPVLLVRFPSPLL